jgi:hypothetical protein
MRERDARAAVLDDALAVLRRSVDPQDPLRVGPSAAAVDPTM